MRKILLFILLILGSGVFPLAAQTEEDPFNLDYLPLLCEKQDIVPVYSIQNRKFSNQAFAGGVFSVNWGDGSGEERMNDATVQHQYPAFGKYTITVKWTGSGPAVSYSYEIELRRWHLTEFGLGAADNCVGTPVEFVVKNYAQKTAETMYELWVDGWEAPIETCTQQEVQASNGIIKHRFDDALCNAQILLKATDACSQSSGQLDEPGFKLTVLKPVTFDFDFENGDEPVCTGIPFTAKVRLLGGDVCDNVVKYEWHFEGNDILNGKEVEVPPYLIPGDYKVTLTSSVTGYACATHTAESKYITVIQRAVAGFTTDEDEYCIAGTGAALTPAKIKLTDKSSGKDIQVSWMVNGSTQHTGKGDWNLELSSPGEYVIKQHVWNSCSDSLVDAAVLVKQDPHIGAFDLPDTLCAREHAVSPADITYYWNGNMPEAVWKVTKPDGKILTFTEVYPVIPFTESGDYLVKVELTGIGCGGTVLTLTKKVNVVRNEITVDVRPGKAPENDTIRLCDGEILGFENHSKGDNLVHEWVVENVGPYAGYLEVVFQEGSAPDSPSPKFIVNGYGDCVIRDLIKIRQGCNQQEAVFKVHVGKAPNITVFSFDRDTLVCEGQALDMRDHVYCEWFNNPENFRWTFTPADLTGDKTQLYPMVEFPRAGKYTLKLELLESRCRTAETVYEKSVDLRVRASALKVEVKRDPADGLLCEGSTVRFRNEVKDAVGEKKDDVTYSWKVVKMGGPEEISDVRNAILPYTFMEYGDYQIIGIAENYCGDIQEKALELTIHKNPRVVLKDTIICPGILEMDKYVTYEWYNNADQQVTWSAEGPGGPLTGDMSVLYPAFALNTAGDYTLRVELPNPGCAEGLDETRAEHIYHVYDTVMSGTVEMIAVGTVTDPENVCEGESVTFANSMTMEREVKWTWSVEGETGGYDFGGGTDISYEKEPLLTFTKAGDYVVKLSVDAGCNSRVYHFSVNVEGIPQVQIADVDLVCEPYLFRHSLISIPNTSDIRQAEWRITPDTGFDPFDMSSPQPDILFHAGTYTVEARYWNRCAEPGIRSFTVNVDEFIDIQPLRDTAVCVLTEPFILKAVPDTGVWSSPQGELLREGEYTYFNPHFDPYDEQDIEVCYQLRNRTCVAYDTMTVHIFPLPHVEAGPDLNMCPNNPPYPLTGQDSVKGSVWQENRGNWFMEGEVLAGAIFSPEGKVPRKYQLTYEFSDIHGCKNKDVTEMTLHPLPVTAFSVNAQNCLYADVVFTPEDTVGNRFEWDFGDNSGHRFTNDTAWHVYRDYGWQEVVCMAESVYGCRDTSASRRIEILQLPPPAYFDVDTLSGCAPFEVNISVTKADYASDHNYLSFHWDYGEGTETDTLGPVAPKFYPSGVWDTTYVTRFTVSNMCGQETYDTTITVYSVPKVSFALLHQWECSPVWLELQNTTTGNNCKFDWTFVNGRTRDTIARSDIRNPVYEFTTDAKATPYYISLKAVNQCSEDAYTDTLVVKPRSIKAHFTPLEHPYACVNQEILFRNNSSDTVATILNTYWNFGDGSQDTLWSPVHKYDKAGTYVVSLKIDNGCGWDTIFSPVTIYPLPQLDIKTEPELCEADTFTFVLISDQELEHIEWQLGDGNIAYKDSLRHVYEGYGDFRVVATAVSAEINQCTDSVIKVVHVNNKPIMTILPLDTMQCTPFFYQPRINGDDFLLLDYGDGSGLTSAREHWYENLSDTAGKYKMTVYAETDKGCKSVYERQVTVFNKPRAILGKQVEKGNPQKVTFFNLSEEYTDCIWDLPFQGSFHSPEDQVVEFSVNGTYPVSLIAANYYGCQDTTAMEHEVLIKGLYFPNTFIPHSLNSRINCFNGIGMGLQQYKLEIFDKYGNKLWETRALEDGKPSEGWNGCNSEGKTMPQDVYIWRAEAIFADDEIWRGNNNESGVPETTQGTVLLLRE